jgi:hypothetical protein
MSIEYRTVDSRGNIYRVTDLFDQFGNETTNSAIAVTCVVRLDDDHWWSTEARRIPIYPVH